MAHVSQVKREEVEALTSLIDTHHVVGLVSIDGIKGKQLQKLRRDLRDRVVLRTSRNTLLSIALKASSKKLENLTPYLKGGASLLCTDMDPFELHMLIEENRTPAFARAGDVCPADIVIPEGDTGLPPGPLVGELQRVGIPAKIERGSITLQKDHLFVREGEVITARQAEILLKLGIEPMTVGLELLGVCEGQEVYAPSVLRVDVEGIRSQLGTAHQHALALATEACIITGETVVLLVQKASRSATQLATEACILMPSMAPRLLERGHVHALIIERLVKGEPLPAAAPAVAPEKKKKEKENGKEKEEEEKSEAEALEGLGTLFG